MRAKFESHLNCLRAELMKAGYLTERALASAKAAFLETNAKKSRKTEKYERRIDDKRKEIERLCTSLLLTQQPVAADLRLVTAAFGMISDMERISDHARDISRTAEIVGAASACYDKIKAMFEETELMIKNVLNSFAESDADLANSVILSDDIMDNYFSEIKNDLAETVKNSPETAVSCMEILMTAKYLERIGDRACAIAGWTIYGITGTRYPEERP